MTTNCKKLPRKCNPATPPVTTATTTPAFSLCVGDYRLDWNGTHATTERVRTTPDGTYGTVTMQGGCVVGYGECEVPVYTPPYCNPAPTPCGQTTSTSTNVVVSPQADNHLKQDTLGLYAHTYISGTNISGDGTKENPYIIGSESTGGSTNPVWVIKSPLAKEERNGVTYLNLEATGVEAGSYGLFDIDKYGRITKIDSNNPPLTAANLTGESEVSVQALNGDVTISLPPSDAAGKHRLGAFDVTVSSAGRVTEIKQDHTPLTEGRYKLGAYLVSVDEYGRITNIEQDNNVPNSAGHFVVDNKRYSYDETGRITSVDTINR